MKPLFAFLCPVVYIWLACYVGVKLLPDGWAATPGTHWWTFPAVITFGVLGLISLIPLLMLIGANNDKDHDHNDFYP